MGLWRYCWRWHRRWCNVLICLCSPCICLTLLFISAGFIVCLRIVTGIGTPVYTVDPEYYHFEAQGTLKNLSFAQLPARFWNLHPHGDVIWNQLQLPIDRYFIPMLNPNKKNEGLGSSGFYESLLKQSFFKVTNTVSRRRNFDKLPQQIQDFVRYMDRRDYPVLIQPDGVCGAGVKDEKEPPLLLLAIKTTSLNFENRQAIRQTWGQAGWVAGQNESSSGGYIRRVFLLGKESSEKLGVNVSELLELESKHYGDILQWDFKDTFFNLTLKDVLFWSWFSEVCGQTLFVLKGDDDVFVNTLKMITFLQDELKKPQADKTIKDFMVGDVIGAALPSRVNNSKYFIPEFFYKGLYPAYAGGGGVVYSGLLTKRLHIISKRVHLFPIDDVYVGMCMIRLNAYPVNHAAFLTFDFPEKEANELCSYHRILLVHKRSPGQLIKLWADMSKTQTQCWNMTLREADKKNN